MDPEKIEELRALIEGEAYNQYDNQMKAKENIDILAKVAKRVFLIEPGIFKKLVKFHYEKSIELESSDGAKHNAVKSSKLSPAEHTENLILSFASGLRF